jgi:hypothetical protein
VTWTVRLLGRGALEVEAVSSGDAEARLERAGAHAWPALHLTVTAVEMLHPEEEERIARSFRVRYRARATLQAAGADAAEARREALREARGRLRGTALERLEWTEVKTGEPR